MACKTSVLFKLEIVKSIVTSLELQLEVGFSNTISFLLGLTVVFIVILYIIFILLDYDKIKGSPCVRTRKQGDYLVVNSAGGRKKLNRIFIDEKIPAGLRDQIPVVAAGSEILWIPGGRMNEQYKITSTTGRVLELHYQGGALA